MFNVRVLGGDRRYPTIATNDASDRAIVATQALTLFSVRGYSPNAQYIQIHDATALPANGTNCLLTLPVLANQWFEWSLNPGLRLYNGLVLCTSSTDIALTLAGADSQFVCDYRLYP